MPVISSLFLILSLALAVLIGPQTRAWTWGPALLALGASLLAALPVIWRRDRGTADFPLMALATLTAGWFAWRSWVSPVAELGQADLLLLCGAVGAFLAMRGIAGHTAAGRVFLWGLAALLGASLWVVARQVMDPAYTPLFGSRLADKRVTGFFAHYNYAANFLMAASLILAASGLLGRHAVATRVVWLVLALSGIAGVYFTQSRGGILGAAAGCAVLAAMALVVAKRNGSRWFAPAVVAVPLVGAGLAAFLIFGWEQRSGGDTQKLLDNDIRLYLLGIATSCIALHPLTGGGSRSFSWECFGLIDNQMIKHGGNRPEMVHNELMQAASDYGLIGAGLLVILLAALVLAALLRISFEDRPREADSRDAWRVGGLAAAAGVLVQSCFSFVFHLFPGAILLGMCMGRMSRATPCSGSAAAGTRLLFTLASLACAAVLLPAGWTGSRVSRILWASYFGKSPDALLENRIDALDEAIAIHPTAELLGDRARLHQQAAIAQTGGTNFKVAAGRALSDYAAGERLHPFEPSFPVNRGNLLSMLGRDDAAETAFARGIQLQGGMEPGFRGHFSLARHHFRKSLRQSANRQTDDALASLEIAAIEIEKAVTAMHWVIEDMHQPRLIIHENLGVAREAAGDTAAALAAYDFAAALRGGRRVHYRAAVLIGRNAVADWSAQQPSKALTGFIEARRRLNMAGNELPDRVTPAERVEYRDYLDRMIAFFKAVKIEPSQ